MQPGLELVHKPKGVTSFSLVQERLELIGKTPGKRLKVCHGGALDPFASGLLLMLYGEATKLMELHHGLPKTYLATIRWGSETDNGDPLGAVTATGDASTITVQRLEDALAPFIGWTEQVPPNTSNKRVGGERAYEKAHRGEQFELPPSRVYLHDARWRSHDLPRESVLELRCKGGYYVRSLARDLGRALGCFAHLSELHRPAIGPWRDPEQGSVQLAGRRLLPWCAGRELSDREVGELRAGREIPAGALTPPDYLLPERWPEIDAPVRGLHREKLTALLRKSGDGLALIQELRNGL